MAQTSFQKYCQHEPTPCFHESTLREEQKVSFWRPSSRADSQRRRADSHKSTDVPFRSLRTRADSLLSRADSQSLTERRLRGRADSQNPRADSPVDPEFQWLVLKQNLILEIELQWSYLNPNGLKRLLTVQYSLGKIQDIIKTALKSDLKRD